MKRTQLSDEMLRCERCGVSFLWPAENQRQTKEMNNKRPVHCPGCSLLLPKTGRERGVVKWYNERKKYGFVTRAAEGEIFTHRSGFEGMGRLRPGDLVEFAVEEGEKGPLAVQVQLLQRAEKGSGRSESGT